jgi:hypothetical protein
MSNFYTYMHACVCIYIYIYIIVICIYFNNYNRCCTFLYMDRDI